MSFARWDFCVKCDTFGTTVNDLNSFEGMISKDVQQNVEEFLTEVVTKVYEANKKDTHMTELMTNAILSEQFLNGAPPISVQLFHGGHDGMVVQVQGHFDQSRNHLNFNKETVRIENENHN